MAIALDVSGKQNQAAGPLSVLLNHAANVLVIAVVSYSTTDDAAVTYGGAAMTLAGKKVMGTSSLQVYYIYRAAAANASITVPAGSPAFVAFSLTGVTDTEPYIELLTSASGSSAAPSVTVGAGTPDRWIIQGIGNTGASVTATPGTGQTEIESDATGANRNAEANYDSGSSSSSAVMDATLSGAATWATIAFGVIPLGNLNPVLCGPRASEPVIRTAMFWGETENWVTPDGSYVRVTLARGAGTPSFMFRCPDPAGELTDLVQASDVRAGILKTIRVYSLADGFEDYMMLGLIERTAETYGPLGREFEISGRQLFHALADYSGNGTAYTSREVNDIITNSADGLLTSIPEAGGESVSLPGVTTTYNPSAATTIGSSLNYLTGLCASTTLEYRWYGCQSEHRGESKRVTCHFEKVQHNLGRYELNWDDVIEAGESSWQVPWESNVLQEISTTTKLEVGQATVEYGDANAVVTTTVEDRPVQYYQLAFTSTSAEATDFGEAITNLRNKRHKIAQIRQPGSKRYVPSNNVYMNDRLNRFLITTDLVTMHHWAEGWVVDLELSVKET